MSLYFITKPEVPSLVDYMYITSITHILQQLHVLHTLYICIILFTSVVKNDLLYNFVAANLFNVDEDVRSRPSTWFVACFLPSLGPESKWDQRGGNSKSVRNTELMMECNDCLLRKLAQQIECEKEKHFKNKLYNVI
jgi:hypothetical protein